MAKNERALLVAVDSSSSFLSVMALVWGMEDLHTEEKWSFFLHLLHVFPNALQSFSRAALPPSPWGPAPQFLHFLALASLRPLCCLSLPTKPGVPSLPPSSAVHQVTRESRSLMVDIMDWVRALSFIDWSDKPDNTPW